MFIQTLLNDWFYSRNLVTVIVYIFIISDHERFCLNFIININNNKISKFKQKNNNKIYKYDSKLYVYDWKWETLLQTVFKWLEFMCVFYEWFHFIFKVITYGAILISGIRWRDIDNKKCFKKPSWNHKIVRNSRKLMDGYLLSSWTWICPFSWGAFTSYIFFGQHR